jgi:Spy/CpxP family protein refolding chaperone
MVTFRGTVLGAMMLAVSGLGSMTAAWAQYDGHPPAHARGRAVGSLQHGQGDQAAGGHDQGHGGQAGSHQSGQGARAGGHDHGSRQAEGHHRSAQACLTEFEKVVGEGRGFGMAFAADQNGYPGPMHVLELKDRLRLSSDQEARVQELMTAMYGESRLKSARLLDAEAALRRLFADGAADEATVRAAVQAVEQARRDVRLVHLLTHLRTRDLLTEEQRRIYHEARWGKP